MKQTFLARLNNMLNDLYFKTVLSFTSISSSSIGVRDRHFHAGRSQMVPKCYVENTRKVIIYSKIAKNIYLTSSEYCEFSNFRGVTAPPAPDFKLNNF